MKILKLIICLMAITPLTFAQMPKGETGTYALTNAKIETITQGTINSGTVVIADGRIAEVGAEVEIPQGATVIDCQGMEIYPGFIDGGTSLGLVEVGSVAETNDNAEIGDFTPHVKALTAINPSAVAIPVTRVNGVTTVIAKPSNGLFPGQAALINLHGYTPQQMYAGFSAMMMEFPTASKRGWWDRREDKEIKGDYEKKIKMMDDFWEKARQMSRILDARKADPSSIEQVDYYPELEAMKPVLDGQIPLMVEVNMAKEILEAIKWVEKKEEIKVIFSGVAEGWKVADELAKANIPVIAGPALSTPARNYDRYDRPYANAGLMQQAGVKVALRTNETENVRNLPFNAAFAAAYGMGRQEALRAITIAPAEIFGVADDYGSIEKGKVANIIVATGDPFETKTQISHLFISGWKMPLASRHTQLYQEFLERSPGVEK